MKGKIKYRLFFAFLAATGVVVISMFLIVQWSIGHGFLTYVNLMEKERLERLADVLEQQYRQSGSWEFVRGSQSTWFRLMATTLPRESEPEHGVRHDRMMARHAELFSSWSGQPPPPRIRHRFEMRVVLLDARREHVAGPPVHDKLLFKTLLHQGKPVGYLGMLPRLRLTDRHQLLFVKQQKLALGLVALVMLLVSAALSLPLANRLVSPIKTLAASLHRLASGEFSTRVTIGAAEELEQLGRDFNLLALTLEKNEQARRNWVADISHELRTPLCVLRGEIEALQDGLREPTPESLRSLHAETMHLTRLVDDLYQLSLHDIGALSYRKLDLDLGEVLSRAMEAFRAELAQKRIACTLELAPAALPIFADPERLHQLFENLLENTLRYTDAGGELRVALRREDGLGVIELQDTPPGVPPEQLDRLFDRLYRVEGSRNRDRGGAGLGLALCKNIVEAHEGKISARPSPLGGVLIRVELPLSGRPL